MARIYFSSTNSRQDIFRHIIAIRNQGSYFIGNQGSVSNCKVSNSINNSDLKYSYARHFLIDLENNYCNEIFLRSLEYCDTSITV